MPPDLFYDVSSKLNDGQLELFNFISKHAIEHKLATKSVLDKPNTFRIFLSGSASVGQNCRKKRLSEINY